MENRKMIYLVKMMSIRELVLALKSQGFEAKGFSLLISGKLWKEQPVLLLLDVMLEKEGWNFHDKEIASDTRKLLLSC